VGVDQSTNHNESAFIANAGLNDPSEVKNNRKMVHKRERVGTRFNVNLGNYVQHFENMQAYRKSFKRDFKKKNYTKREGKNGVSIHCWRKGGS